eukprot:60652_1
MITLVNNMTLQDHSKIISLLQSTPKATMNTNLIKENINVSHHGFIINSNCESRIMHQDIRDPLLTTCGDSNCNYYCLSDIKVCDISCIKFKDNRRQLYQHYTECFAEFIERIQLNLFVKSIQQKDNYWEGFKFYQDDEQLDKFIWILPLKNKKIRRYMNDLKHGLLAEMEEYYQVKLNPNDPCICFATGLLTGLEVGAKISDQDQVIKNIEELKSDEYAYDENDLIFFQPYEPIPDNEIIDMDDNPTIISVVDVKDENKRHHYKPFIFIYQNKYMRNNMATYGKNQSTYNLYD